MSSLVTQPLYGEQPIQASPLLNAQSNRCRYHNTAKNPTYLTISLGNKCKCTLSACSTGCSPHSVDVLFGIIWGVILNDPVHLGNVKTSSCHVSAQKYALDVRCVCVCVRVCVCMWRMIRLERTILIK